MFAQVEAKLKKDINALITRPGVKLERADLPLKWSGLEHGDRITALYHRHPPAKERRFQVVTSPQGSLAQTWLSKKIPSGDAVSMGAFGDTIAQTAGLSPNAARAANAGPLLPAHWGLDTAAHGSEHDGDSPNHWLGALGLTTVMQSADLNIMPPIPPSSEDPADVADDEVQDIDQGLNIMRLMPTPPDVMPDEFEDLPVDAFVTPHHQTDVLEGVSPNKPRLPRKVASSPPPPASAALTSTTPTSSRLGDLSSAPTPSRRLVGPSGQSRVDAQELKKKLEEKQKQNDTIWANIAATLEPAQLEPARRTFLSHTASGGAFGNAKKLPPSMPSMSIRLR